MASLYDYNCEYDSDSDGGASWDATPVTFFRPDGDTEGKDVQWCLDSDFFEIEEGYWSGNWYYRFHPDERPLHAQRLQRTREIRQRTEQRRAPRVRVQRSDTTGGERQHAQEAATLMSVLMGDIARQKGIPAGEIGAFIDGLAESLGAKANSGRSNTAPRMNTSGYENNFGSPYTTVGTYYSPNARAYGSPYDYTTPSGYVFSGQQQQPISQSLPKKKKSNKRHQKPYPSYSKEGILARQQRILENVVHWAEGDQGIVDRTRAAFQESDDRPHKCPCCISHFPTYEVALLHANNAAGKAHTRYRREVGIPQRDNNQDYSNYVRCAACFLEFPSQELADFHLKNHPRHSRYRLEHGIGEEWDHNLPEKFCCPVCQQWFLSRDTLEEHVETQTGKAHDRYRKYGSAID